MEGLEGKGKAGLFVINNRFLKVGGGRGGGEERILLKIVVINNGCIAWKGYIQSRQRRQSPPLRTHLATPSSAIYTP